MAVPSVQEARPFYQSAIQRFEDSQILYKANRTTGAVYLAGYAVECMLKALILAAAPKKERKIILDSFRGNKAHDFGWLKSIYGKYGGRGFPKEINVRFQQVSSWGPWIRYESGSVRKKVAKEFTNAVAQLLEWTKEQF
jgi:hypothetical protein